MAFGKQQRLAIAGLGLGLLFCALGTISPFWEGGSKTQIGFTVTVGIGLWYSCLSSAIITQCSYNEAEDGSMAGSKLWVCRVFSLFTLILAMAAFCGGLCGCRNAYGGRTTGQGVSALASGGAGIITLAVFSTIFPVHSYGWSFILFIIGTILICLNGLLLVIAQPLNTSTNQGMVMSGGLNPGVVVSNNSSSQQGYVGPGYPINQQQPYPGQAYPGQAYPGQAYQYPPPGIHQNPQSFQNSEQKTEVYDHI